VTPTSEAGAHALDARSVWAIHMTARRVLEVVVRQFEAAGIEALGVKGVVTAHTLYREPTERPMGDVDLRIRADDFERAGRIARDAGWKIAEWKPAYRAFTLSVEGLGVAVDVESAVGPPGLCGLSVSEMLSRATRGAGGADVRVPELHDHAVLLSVNLFKDKFTMALPWAIEDTRRIVEAAGFDEDRFVDRARRAKVASIGWIVADWMARERGSASWKRIREKLGGERAPRPLYAWAFRRLQEKAPLALATRLLARIGADQAAMWSGALGRALAWQWASRARL
jgi:hypothetical protein